MGKFSRVKIAGRWVDAPRWALDLPFEVRPSRGFRTTAWALWKPTLTLRLAASGLTGQVLDVRR